MTFVLSKILWAFLKPSTFLITIGCIGLILTWMRRRRTGMTMVTLCLAGYLSILLLPVDQWVLLPLEDRFPRPAPPDHVDGVIVLGGATNPALSDEHGIPALTSSAERMTEFAALALRYPNARMVFTGGNGTLRQLRHSEADLARQLFASLGLGERGIVYEDRSHTTWENAEFSRDIVHPKPGEVWLLVTSASHMPRAVGIFRAVGWPVLAWPTAYKAGHSSAVQNSGELPDRLEGLDWGTHEWLGLLTNRLTGRTRELLPAPEA